MTTALGDRPSRLEYGVALAAIGFAILAAVLLADTSRLDLGGKVLYSLIVLNGMIEIVLLVRSIRFGALYNALLFGVLALWLTITAAANGYQIGTLLPLVVCIILGITSGYRASRIIKHRQNS